MHATARPTDRKHQSPMAQNDLTAQAEEYSGLRILEAMHEAVFYSHALYGLIRAAKPPEAKRILEFGAGDGTFISKFRQDGVAVECVEIDSGLREVLSRGGAIVHANIRDVETGSCDFIYTVNVLEHIPDLRAELEHVCRVLRPGGVLFVFVPAFKVLWTSLDTEAGHLTRFSRTTLRDALTSGGVEVVSMEFFDSLGFAAALTVRILEGMNAFRYESKSVKFYDRCVFPVSRTLDRGLRHFVGKNLVAVTRKP